MRRIGGAVVSITGALIFTAGCSSVDRTAELNACEREVRKEVGPRAEIKAGSYRDLGDGEGRITGGWEGENLLGSDISGTYTCGVFAGQVTLIDH